MPSKSYQIRLDSQTWLVIDYVMVKGRIVTMKTTSANTCRHRVLSVNRKALVKLPKKTGDIETWLVSMGGKPVSAKMQKKLAGTGNWGMPKE